MADRPLPTSFMAFPIESLQRGRRSSRRIGPARSIAAHRIGQLQHGRRSFRRIGWPVLSDSHVGTNASTWPPLISADWMPPVDRGVSAGVALQRDRRSSRRIGYYEGAKEIANALALQHGRRSSRRGGYGGAEAVLRTREPWLQHDRRSSRRIGLVFL
ncbi:hypothetical protein [Pendulispora rubella]|uniref:hypothetical protein n=1 Tax=Pendulispora rubella TaxID=2741070 RepID=UPI0038B34461